MQLMLLMWVESARFILPSMAEAETAKESSAVNTGLTSVSTVPSILNSGSVRA